MKTTTKYLLTIFSVFFSLVTTFGQDFPPVEEIDFYGLRTISEKNVRSLLMIKTNDEWKNILESIEENRRRLKTLPNVEDAAINLVCCDDLSGKSIVYVGIREKGAAVLSFRAAASGTIRLPENITQVGSEFQSAFIQAIAAKDFSEDVSQGHSLVGNKTVRLIQEKFITLAAENLVVLRRVLRESGDEQQRALAAQVIAYVKDKREVTDDLVFAVSDANESVRNNATRALILIAIYADINPQLKIKIPADRFIKMLDSLEWTDRNKSLGVLDALTKKRESALLLTLKKESFVSLTEMARWKNPGHARAAFFILGRIADLSEEEIENSWKLTNREQEIKKILEKIKSK